MSSTSPQPPVSSIVIVVTAGIVSVVTTAILTHIITKRNENEKQRQIVIRQYKREQLLKEKIAKERMAHHEPPSGTLLKDVQVNQIYLWECIDLRTKFTSAMVNNRMIMKPNPISTIRSPILRSKSSIVNNNDNNNNNKKSRSSASDKKKNNPDEESRITQYNKLITDHECILGDVIRKPNMNQYSVAFMRAGPRGTLHFDPKHVSSAIVTCGGLCPGLNNVIREITKTLHQIYGIGGHVYGIQGGYRGFYDTSDHLQPILLTPDIVENIHHNGGTVLGSSRGGFDLEKIIQFLKDHKICQLYVIGGDGTHRGAYKIHEGCIEHGMNVSVAGIPKTIDNDIAFIDQSFGFASAVEAALTAIHSAKTEAVCNLPNGIGIVKLMGRSAGYIAAHATMSSSDVDLCLVPEVPVVLDGPKGCLPHLYRRVKTQGYAVVVVAEGAGEEVLGTSMDVDASGNKKLPPIGEYMKSVIIDYFHKQNDEATVKYIDPSYLVRSIKANASDSLYCMQLAQNAVHGSMAGYTGFSVGRCNDRMVYIPIPELVQNSPRSMNPNGRTWERVLTLTRQPNTVPEKLDDVSNSNIMKTKTTTTTMAK